MKKFRAAVFTGLAIAASLALSGCGSLEAILNGTAGERSGEVLTAAAPEPLWKTDVALAGTGAAIAAQANTAVSYISRDDKLMLAGFSLEDGSEKWAYPANTGSQSPEYPVLLRMFVDADRTFVVNVLDPVNGSPDASGYFTRGHPLQIIDVETGEVVATTEPRYWVGSVSPICLSESHACLLSLIDGAPATLSVSSTGEMRVNESNPAFAGYSHVDRLDNDGTFVAQTEAGVPTIGRFRHQEIEWARPFSELGVTDLTRAERNTGYEDLFLQTGFFSADGKSIPGPEDADVAIVTTRIIDTGQYKDSTGVFSTSALDAKTGETLWSAEGALCFADAPVLCSGESTIRDNNGVMEFLPSDQLAWEFDPQTGEKNWEVTLENMVLAEQSGWETPERSTLQLFRSGNDYMLIDVTQGTVSPLLPEQMFYCDVEGVTFSAPQHSYLESPMVTWATNFDAAGCNVDQEVVGAADFTEAVVIAGSPEPVDAPDNWNIWEKQLRVVSTAEGLVAYEL